MHKISGRLDGRLFFVWQVTKKRTFQNVNSFVILIIELSASALVTWQTATQSSETTRLDFHLVIHIMRSRDRTRDIDRNTDTTSSGSAELEREVCDRTYRCDESSNENLDGSNSLTTSTVYGGSVISVAGFFSIRENCGRCQPVSTNFNAIVVNLRFTRRM